MQYAMANYMADAQPYVQLAKFYQEKRDFFRQGLAGSRLKLLPCEGTYFQSVDISAVSPLSDTEFCKWLTTDIGVAAIPLSAFYGNGFDQHVIRFCFAKKTDTLVKALEKLQRL
jgi:methionine aminotransferase